jgi:hypothetical protein
LLLIRFDSLRVFKLGGSLCECQRLFDIGLFTVYNDYRVSYALLNLSLHVLDGVLHPLMFFVPVHPLKPVSLVLDGLVNGFGQLLLISNHDGGEHHRDVISPFCGFLSRATRVQLTLGSFLLI